MAKRKPCPIPGCEHKWEKIDGLGQHLYNEHRKAEVVKALLKLLSQA